ncbi:ArnT family glycosyltransferase [Lewinella sp. LCG006]|uniref:ArnT family glycosyltransferase n=1 Tax=Lewinella sp. LCG006 TaxID=3231911 RepID=UPI00345F214F
MKRSLRFWFWLLVVGLSGIFLLPELIRGGMYYDGMAYSLISRNMAYGYGSFWEPMFTPVIWPVFYEHPPAGFGLQSLFFRLLGDGWLVERFFALVVFIVSLLLLRKLWLKSNPLPATTAATSLDWLPVFLWILAPSVGSVYARNMLEGIVTVFTIAAILLMLRALQDKKGGLLFVAAGVLCTGAFLTKGFTGLFPWAVPFLWWLTYRDTRWTKMLLRSVLLIASTLAFLGLLLIDDTAFHSMGQYLDQQVFRAIRGDRELAVYGRFHILIKMAGEFFYMLLPLALMLVLVPNDQWRSCWRGIDKKVVLFWVLVGASASLPVMISLKQFSYYVVPAYPYFAMALAMVIKSFWEQLQSVDGAAGPWRKIVRPLAILVLLSAVVASVSSIGKSRDTALLADVEAIGKYQARDGTFYNCLDSLEGDHRLQAYLFRYHYQTVTRSDTAHFLLLEHGKTTCELIDLAAWTEVERLHYFTLLRRKN